MSMMKETMPITDNVPDYCQGYRIVWNWPEAGILKQGFYQGPELVDREAVVRQINRLGKTQAQLTVEHKGKVVAVFLRGNLLWLDKVPEPKYWFPPRTAEKRLGLPPGLTIPSCIREQMEPYHAC